MGKRFQIGEAVFETTVTCDPCERMEQAIGVGAYNAMTGHGGICARIIQSGSFKRGDQLTVLSEQSNQGVAVG
jgi:MOSC domain-containing protein YiiM